MALEGFYEVAVDQCSIESLRKSRQIFVAIAIVDLTFYYFGECKESFVLCGGRVQDLILLMVVRH